MAFVLALLACIAGPSLYFLNSVGAIGLADLNLLECLVFSSLISAVDPVAVSTPSQNTDCPEGLAALLTLTIGHRAQKITTTST